MTDLAASPLIRLLVDENALVDWLVAAEPGQVLTYHQGLLALDLDPRTRRMNATERSSLAAIAERLREEADRGTLHLLQRRLGREHFDYIAVAAAPVATARLHCPAPASGRRS